MAIAVDTGHVNNAINFINNNQDKCFIELAKSDDWSNPEVPDVEVDNVSELQGSLGFIKVKGVYLVSDGGSLDSDDQTKDDNNNQIMYAGRKWNICNSDNALQNNARYVLFDSELEPTDLPDMTFYQTGIRIGTKFADTVINNNAVTPDYIIDKGTLIAYENHKAISINNQIKLKIKYLIKF